MTTAHIIFFLQLVACSLLIVSILVIFEDEIRKKMLHVLKLLTESWNGEKRRIANLKNSEGLCEPSSTRSKKNWGWISNWKNKWRGYVREAPLWAMCLFAAMAFASVPMKNWLARSPVMQYSNVYVIRPVGAYGYWLRINGNKVYTVFCQDFGGEPQFDTGETIQTLTIRDLGDCWSVHNMHPAFIMLRDELTGELIRRPDKEN